MSENETALAEGAQAKAEGGQASAADAPAEANAPEAAPAAEPVSQEEITYHAVEKDGQVSAIWEMQGRKHLRTIDPRSRQGQEILRLYTAENQ
ncbi:MAG: hypothetical protein LC785_03955 [Acidobacteria bacterium]|nr:hypothetical protein [Acidobacteriota bacterium]MCA1641138.1 hypothetical protein [Acidobacteriota bacterium]